MNIFVIRRNCPQTSLVALDCPRVTFLALADKVDEGSPSRTAEAIEVPQFWCKLFEMK